jgi:hypothetical protein
MRRQDEFRLACVVADYLARALPVEAIWTHFPAGENRSAITGARLKRMGTARGWPDYLIIYRGKLLGLELKAEGGSVSPHQRHIGESFKAHGFDWSVIKSTEEVEKFLTRRGIPLRATVLARAA